MNARNLYLNGDIPTARERGYDIVQLKYDGWFCKTLCHPHQTEFYSETDRQFAVSAPVGLDGCIFVGEFMRGTQWSQHPDRKGLYYVFDVWALFGEPLTVEPYSTRYAALRKLKLPPQFKLVPNFRIADAEAVWQRFVLNDGYEGIVFRRTTSPLDDAVIRCKREYTLDGFVVGFEPGLGKHEGSLGAVKVHMLNGTTTSIGNGFTDDERRHIMDNQSAYMGRWLEFTTNAIFESGNVRHGRFVRWREDKV